MPSLPTPQPPPPPPLPPQLAPIPLQSSKVLGFPVQGMQCLDCRSFYEAVGTWGHHGEALPACGHVLPPGVCFSTAPHARINQHQGM